MDETAGANSCLYKNAASPVRTSDVKLDGALAKEVTIQTTRLNPNREDTSASGSMVKKIPSITFMIRITCIDLVQTGHDHNIQPLPDVGGLHEGVAQVNLDTEG